MSPSPWPTLMYLAALDDSLRHDEAIALVARHAGPIAFVAHPNGGFEIRPLKGTTAPA